MRVTLATGLSEVQCRESNLGYRDWRSIRPEDFANRDDKNWLKHTMAWRRNGKLEIGYKSVVITKYQPKERVY